MRKLIAVAVVLLVAVPSLAQANSDEEHRRKKLKFALFTNCRPLRVDVAALDFSHLGTSKFRQQDKYVLSFVEKKMRDAKLYNPKSHPLLFVSISMFFHSEKQSSMISEVRVMKYFTDRFSNITMMLSSGWKSEFKQETPWNRGAISNHLMKNHHIPIKEKIPYSLAGIMEILSRQLDTFIAEYLRVNEAACRKRGVLK